MEKTSRERIPMSCPSCSRNLRGKRIPRKNLGFYDGETHYSRVVGIYDEERDTLPGEGHGPPPGFWQRARTKLNIGR